MVWFRVSETGPLEGHEDDLVCLVFLLLSPKCVLPACWRLCDPGLDMCTAAVTLLLIAKGLWKVKGSAKTFMQDAGTILRRAGMEEESFSDYIL